MAVIFHLIEASATGTLSMCQLLANYQAKTPENTVYVVYSRRPETPIDIEKYFSGEVEVVYMDMSSALGKLITIRKVRASLQSTDATHLIMHSSFAGFLGRLASLGLGISRVYIPHCISFMRKDLTSIARFVYERLERFAHVVPCTYVACSESEARAIRTVLSSANVSLIENAIERPTIKPFVEIGHRKKLRVITVGQIRAQKGPEEFAEIASIVCVSGVSVEFVWVGDGDSGQKYMLENKGVRVLGWVEKASVSSLLANADIYLSTARWEGLPVSLIEAQYAGLPVVASNCAGNVDVIDDGSTGILFDNVNEAVDGILRLSADASLRKKLGVAGHEMSLDRFSSDKYFRNFDKLLGLKN